MSRTDPSFFRKKRGFRFIQIFLISVITILFLPAASNNKECKNLDKEYYHNAKVTVRNAGWHELFAYFQITVISIYYDESVYVADITYEIERRDLEKGKFFSQSEVIGKKEIKERRLIEPANFKQIVCYLDKNLSRNIIPDGYIASGGRKISMEYIASNKKIVIEGHISDDKINKLYNEIRSILKKDCIEININGYESKFNWNE